MPGRYLLDTNIIIALFASDASVQQRLASGVEVFVPSIAIGELHYGARKSARSHENIQRINQFVAASAVLACDVATAPVYGTVKDDLRCKGRPLPENDIWIAAVALQHGLRLVSRDAHFNAVDGLALESW
jgi:tRNA(fMet)-specific endonuclease VapC